MSLEAIALTIFVTVIIAIVAGIVASKRPKKLKQDKFTQEWKELQKLCGDKENWPEVIIRADKMLDKALKKRKYKGKSMGERLVSAQKTFKSNDDVWFAHNIYKKIIAEPDVKLKMSDVKDALGCFRQALRDIGALELPPSQQKIEQNVEEAKK